MNISSVKLIDDGRHGLEVKFMQTSVGDGGYTFQNEYVVKYKMPVGKAIKALFESLTESYKLLLGLDSTSPVTPFKISAGMEDFKISAHVECTNGKIIDIASPKVLAEHIWDNYDSVMKIVDKLHKEVILYADGKHKLDTKQVIIDFVQHEEKKASKLELTREMVEAMSKEEISEWATKVLEEEGCIVLQQKK